MVNVVRKALSADANINGLLWDGWKMADPVIAFAFPTSAENGGYGFAINGFRALDPWSTTDPYVLGANFAFSQIRSFTQLRVLEMQGGDSLAAADIKIAMAEGKDMNGDGDFNDADEMFAGGTLADGAPPDPAYGAEIGQIFVDPTPSAIGNERGTMMHEIGHALGLKHPFETTAAYGGAGLAPTLNASLNNYNYTLMGYGSGDEPSTYMRLDILALQYLYGANYEYNATSTTYRWDPVTGEMFVNGRGQGAPANGKIFMTIWDGGGANDRYDFSNYTTDLTIDLNPGASSRTSAAQLARFTPDGGSRVNAQGNIFNAYLFEGDPRSLIEHATGGSGHDRITGNDANNILRGGGGNDILRGGRGTDTLEGGAGDDELRGEDDADIMRGGRGNDTYYVGAGDTVEENLIERAGSRWVSGGNDTVITSLRSYTLGFAVENLVIGANPLGTGLSSVESTGIGNELDNALTGRRGKEKLYGLDGADILNGGRNADYMAGGSGNDTYYVDDAGDVVDETYYVRGGGTGVLTFNSGYRDYGDAGDTVITTLSTYDLSNTGSNNAAVRAIVPATLYGIVENLTYIGSSRFTGIGNAANNIITGGSQSDNLYGGEGHDTLRGGLGNDGLDLGAGDDKAYIDNGTAEGGDVVVGGGGFDSVYADDSTIATGLRLNLFRAGTAYTPDVNRVAFTSAAIDVDFVEGNSGNDIIDASRLDRTIQISGMIGNDTIIGGSGSDYLYGGDDEDTITGGLGNDGIHLGAGNDKAWIDNGTAEGGDVVVGAGGFDTVYADATTIATGLRLNLFRAGTDYTPDVNRVAFTSAAIDVDSIVGNDGNDYIDASRLGSGLYTTISGGRGNDTLVSGASSEFFDGNANFDKIVYDGLVANYKFDWVDSVRRPYLQITDLLTGVADGVRNVEIAVFRWNGTETSLDLKALLAMPLFTEGADTVVLPAIGRTFDALGGDDRLIYTGGQVTIVGGTGNDTTDFSGFGAAIWVDLGLTEPQAWTRDSVDLASGNWRQIASFNGVENIVGTAFADELNGGGEANTLEGGDGNDTLAGGGGADILDGGRGNDVFHVDNLDTVRGGEGFDIALADASTSPGGFAFAVAGTAIETVFGGAGNDTLDASATTDFYTQLFGGEGNDRLIAGSGGSYTLQGGAGVDTAVFAGNQADYTINATPAGWPSWITVTHNATGARHWLQTTEMLQFADGTIEAPGALSNFNGTADGDILMAGGDGQAIYGLAGDDRITCGSGNDILDGGAGADSLIAGGGNDVLFVDSNDILVDGGEGFDTVYADDTHGTGGLRFNLAGTNVEFVYGGVGKDVLNATGVTTTVSLWGQWGDDKLTGGSGDDYIMGDEWLPGGGNDVIDGGAGNDWLSGGSGNDVFVFRTGSGRDFIDDFGQAGDLDAIRFESTVFSNFDQLSASGAMAQVGADVVITLTPDDQITLLGTTLENLHQGHFQFA